MRTDTLEAVSTVEKRIRRMPRVFISTAEASAELHASHLVKALAARTPNLDVAAAGGEILEKAGAQLVVNTTGQAVMGFWEAINHLAFYKRAEDAILKHLEKTPPDALIVVDAPSFHLHLAKKVHARWPKLPLLYYIAPKLWAWKEWRVKNLRRDFTRTMCIFPFEVEFFQSRGVDAVFVGNPTLDQLRDVDGRDMTRILRVEDVRRHSNPEKGVLAVFPGSRASEIKYLWPLMTKTVELLRRRFPDLKAAVALAPGWTKERLTNYAPAPENVSFVGGDSQKLLAAASVALAKSGTATLEAALLGVPMAVCYAGDPASYYIAKMFVKLPHVSLPNILAGKELVKEFIQRDATPANLAGEIGRLLTDKRYYRRMRSKLRGLRNVLGEEYAAPRAAKEIEGIFSQ